MIQRLLLLWSIFQCVAEPYQDFDAVLEAKLAKNSLASNSELMHLSFDDGLYWTSSVEIVSKSVELHGNKTGLTHRANLPNDRNRNDAENGNGSPRTEASIARWMMDVQNSSLAMRSWRLDAGMEGSSICMVFHSSVEVIDSEIFSNIECSGFVLADEGISGSSRIVIVGSSHKSSTPNVVLPLVGRGYGQLNKNNEDWMGDGEGWSDDCAEREDIIGVELSIDSTHFALGTGPLFSFTGKLLPEGSEIGMFGEVSTELRLSRLSNVTSHFGVGNGKSLGVGNCVWERVVGSRIERSTNHDMGTGLCGTRLGGNIACVNSSFSSCVRTSNDIVDYQHKTITQSSTGRTSRTAAGTTSVTFTLCTFNTMTVSTGNNNGGAAVNLVQSQSMLTVTQCFFHKCTCTGEGNDGGAICVYEARSDRPISITLSSFTECKLTFASGAFGGSVYCSGKSSLSITDCFFEKSESAISDGAISLKDLSPATVSNCAFVLCHASNIGGALSLHSITSFDLSFLQFRQCSANDAPKSKDLFFAGITAPKVNSTNVRDCDSTSTAQNVYVSNAADDLSYLVPQLDSPPPTVTASVSISGETATVTATANPAVKGTMGILLKGSNVPRLVHVVFGSKSETSTTGSVIVSSGAKGVLPSAPYSHHSSSIASKLFPPTSVHAADSSLKDVNTTTILLTGVNLGKGSYSMLIQNGGSTFNVSLTRSDSTTLVGEAPLYPLDAPERLEWSTQYEVKQVMWLPQGGTEENVPLTDTITFKTPTEPPRIASWLSHSLNGERTQLIVIFEGSSLPDAAGTIKVKRSDDLLIEGVLTRNSATKCTAVISTAWDEDAAHLAFGTTYSVDSAKLGSTEIAVNSGIEFKVPNPPVITSFSLPTECSSYSFDFEVIGQDLPSSDTYTLTLSGSHTVPITFSSGTKGKGTVEASLPSKVQFDSTYSVLSVKKGDDHVLLNATSFKTPLGPTLNSVSIDWTSPNKKEVILSLSGERMMTGTHNLTFVEQGETTNLSIMVTIDTTTTGSGSAVVFDGPILKYGQKYDVLSLTSNKLHFALAASLKFETLPEPPRLTSIACDGLSDKGRKADFSVGGRNMLIDGQYTITVNKTGTAIQKSIGVTMSSTEVGAGRAVLFSQTEGEIELDFGTDYDVVGVTDSSKSSILFETTLTFKTPEEPTRLVLFERAGYAEKEKEVKFEMAGRVLDTTKTYKVDLSISNALKHTVSMSFDSEKMKWEGSAILFPLDVRELEYGKTYTVSSFKMGDETDELFFEPNEITIGSEPSRLVKIETADDEGLNSTSLTLSSRVLTVGEEYEMKVIGTPFSSSSSSNANHETTIKFTVSSATSNTVRLTLYPLDDAIVKYGHSYCVDLMKVVGGDPIFIETETCEFTTPHEPARICNCSDAVLNKDRSVVTLTLEGRALAEPLGSIWVSFGGTFWDSSSMRQMSETHCEADFNVASDQSLTHLKYKEVYSVCLKPAQTTTLLVNSGITVTIPAPPSFTDVHFEFTNSLGTGCIAVLTGTDLVKGTEYKVILDTLHTFSIVVKSSSRAESSEMEIGREGALAYSQNILIATVTPTEAESGAVLVPLPSFAGQTPARPKMNEIFVDAETGRSDWTCGDSSRPCSTMGVAWSIIRTLDISQPTFSLVKGTSLSSQLRIESGMSVLIHEGAIHEPSLNIPSSAAESATSALIVVSSALLNIQNIDIVVGSSKPSFVLISASSSEMILKDGLITIKSDTNENRNEMEELCSWTTGLIELIETELNVTDNHFFDISQGVINMKGGQLTIKASSFTNNSQNHQTFPSARRNIACSEGGQIHVNSLSAGDGFKTPSMWISSEDCTIKSTEVSADAPLFIPTLSSDSTSKLDKKTKSFTLTIEGTTLIPCSLFLKVFEMGKDGKEVNSKEIPLTQDSATSFNETRIVLTLPTSSLESLDDSLEWRGKLIFGDNQTTNNTFLIQQSSSGRFAQALKDNMKWWIPLVVVVLCALLALILVVILLVRRRNKNKRKNDGAQELDQTEDKIDVFKDDDNENSVHTVGQKQLNPALTFINTTSLPSIQNTREMVPTSSGQTPVLVVGEDAFGRPKIEDGFADPHDTLFNRLHGRDGRGELNINQTRLDMAKAVETLLSLRPKALAFQKLSPHWVLFSPSNRICFKLNDDTPSQAPTTIPTQSGARKETQEEKRWSAPEEENRDNEIDEVKVTVFRLGLILWEITTGQVPFSETDAVNAQRQLRMGIVPVMDSVEPVELAALLSECLDLNPLSRPSVESVVSRLESIGRGKKEEAADLLELPNHALEPKPESQNPASTFQHE
ncbi:hypothetical protein BLNAU_5215 [Blattamonas nauphoetae]|uniref:Protein kinase domain-containing protein n=1 Tax=Blattamonas nauphoetae TaxID=2049346 RepID=A0ABQ9Y7I2_9EUKA|nr:hypothetical protein BLNAU_5215 [Blattamonas nauphoetae]